MGSSSTHTGIRSRLFLVASDGKLVSRRPDVWAANWDKCQMCGTTEKPHEARGYCHNCFAKWRRATNHNGYRDKQNACNKRRLLRTNYQEEYDAKRQYDPKRRAQRREICLRWAKKNAKFAPGTIVEYEIIKGFWGRATVLLNGRGKCVIQSTTSEFRTEISHKLLRKVEA